MASLALRGVQCQRVMCGTVAQARQKHTLTGSGEWVPQKLHSGYSSQTSHNIHQSMTNQYPSAESVSLPGNVEELERSEKVRFSRKRSRDTSSAQNAAYSGFSSGFMGDQGAKNQSFTGSMPTDSHVDVYDCNVSVSLASVMQTNVPKPFDAQGMSDIGPLSMPGGGWAQDDKYISGDLHDFHHTNSSARVGKKGSLSENNTSHSLVSLLLLSGPAHTKTSITATTNLTSARPQHACGIIPNTRGLVTWCGSHNNCDVALLSSFNPLLQSHALRRHIHTNFARAQEDKAKATETPQGNESQQLTAGQKLQRAVKEYGSTVIVFHVTISLASLGICYLLVSSGLDMTGIIKTLGLKLGSTSESLASTTNIVDGPTETLLEVDEQATSVEDWSDATTHNAALVDDVSDATAHNAIVEEGSDVASKVAGVSTFVVAYALHKCFAPLRIAATLTATPLIVRHLRRIGVLKPPKPKAA